MLIEEHARTARAFLDESDALFAEGDVLQASEKVGSSSPRGNGGRPTARWPYENHRSLKNAARRLSSEPATRPWDRFAVAENSISTFITTEWKITRWTTTARGCGPWWNNCCPYTLGASLSRRHLTAWFSPTC